MSFLAFAIIFMVTVGSACLVAFSNKLIYSAFALIGAFMGVAATFVMLNAEFLGLAQIMIYAGGILVLTVFAVMLTARIDAAKSSNPVINKKMVVPVMGLLVVLLGMVVTTDKWTVSPDSLAGVSSTASIGSALLGKYVLAFELLSVVLLMAMMGAAIITRRHVKNSAE